MQSFWLWCGITSIAANFLFSHNYLCVLIWTFPRIFDFSLCKCLLWNKICWRQLNLMESDIMIIWRQQTSATWAGSKFCYPSLLPSSLLLSHTHTQADRFWLCVEHTLTNQPMNASVLAGEAMLGQRHYTHICMGRGVTLELKLESLHFIAARNVSIHDIIAKITKINC